MNNERNKEKDVKVSILFTESISSLLKLKVPYLEELHSSESKVCIITKSETNYKKPIRSARDIKLRNKLKEWDSNLKSDLAFFSETFSENSSVTVFDDFSQLSLGRKSTTSNINLPYNLAPLLIHTRPLVTVRSIAHGGKLESESSNILISLLNDADGSDSKEYICRICHGGDSVNDLFTPCRCRGSVALAHLECLERWLKESTHSYCELCQHRFEIIREPKYSILWSILVFLRHPGNHLPAILVDLIGFIVYTPSAIAANYMLLILCEAIAKQNAELDRTLSTHVMALSALFGMTAIDFTYTSWLVTTMQKHIEAWREWYKNNSTIKIILPKNKLKPKRYKKQIVEIIED